MILLLFDYIGYYGPIITFMTTFYNVFEKHLYLLVFIIGSITNIGINEALKLAIREPRPEGQIYFIDSNELSGPHLYGMPSAHMQSCIFSVVYLYLVRGYPYLLLVSLFISALTFYQRWKYNRHTIKQLLIGSFIGGSYAWFLIYILQHYYFNYTNSYFII
jgi:hypothetical protein